MNVKVAFSVKGLKLNVSVMISNLDLCELLTLQKVHLKDWACNQHQESSNKRSSLV
jgi:hypothetical protein